jgi:hypothetical protein
MKIHTLAAWSVAMLLAHAPVSAFEPADADRLNQVEQRGAEIMPFSLGRTLHVFSKTERGGVQQVLVKDTADAGQIGLIRAHLREEAARFARGDYADPAGIHGDDMPGLAELRRAQPGQIEIVYSELPLGAQIVYSTLDPALIAAIHRWFDAQLGDHARHAVPGLQHDHTGTH